MNKEELLYNEIYERTKDFGRNQFVREIMRLQRENKELEQKVNQLETNIEEAIEYINNSWTGGYTDKSLKYKVEEINITELLSLLERGKE